MPTSAQRKKPDAPTGKSMAIFHKAVGTPLLMAIGLQFVSLPAIGQVDEDAATALAKKSQCFKCHSVDKRKKAPSYKEIAAKYSDKPDAEKLVYLHITGNPEVKFEDESDRHTSPNTKDDKEIYNLVQWILTR